MENNIDNYFRKLSEEQKPKSFPNMDNIWDKVEEKLDEKKKKRIIPIWKYAGVAAALLLLITLGSRFINPKNPETETTDIVVIDQEKIQEEFDSLQNSEDVVAFEDVEELEDKVQKAVKSTSPVITEKESISTETSEVVAMSDDVSVKEKSDSNFNFTYKMVDESKADAEVVMSANADRTKEVSKKESAEKIVTGVVTSAEDGLSLPGASVVVEGTTRGTSTDIDGKYSINTKQGEKLVFSFIGTKSQTITVGASNVINVALSSDVLIESVVVMAYGAPTKTKKEKSFKSSQDYESSYMPSLRGEVSGVNVFAGNGSPGSDSTIRIRGNSSLKGNAEPLYIIDGKPISSDEFRKINAKDIENISVLKDENATSIYGNRGANGVILIQSKKDFKKKGKRNVGENIKLEDIDKIFPPKQIEVNTESYENFIENQFESAKSNPVSTFSIDVDNASYTNIRRFINNGQSVPKDAVRIEEMINFFKYDYTKPTGQHPFSIHTEYSDAPWNKNHKLLRIALQGKEIPTDKLPKSNFVFLVDVSGSMSAQNKLPLLQASMKVLLDELRDDDRVSIVYYANNVGVLLEPTKASEKQKIIEVIDNMYASGGTSGGAGLELAYEMAEKHFVKGGNNRIILATDGDFNIGKSSDKDMQELIEEKRKSGVFLTCLGFGMGNYKDSKMVTLSKKGNGNYAYIDNIQEANRFLGKEFKGSMFAIAKDVKIQIEFNPAHVQAYRLIGYEMRKLRNEDFTNDAIDAGELGSGHTVTALYEVIPNGMKSDFFSYENDLKYTQNTVSGSFQNELATVKFRYKKPDGDKSVEMIHTIPNQSKELKFATKDFKFATSVAWFGLKLRDSKLIPNKESKEIIRLAEEGIQNDTDGYKAEFIRLIKGVK